MTKRICFHYSFSLEWTSTRGQIGTRGQITDKYEQHLAVISAHSPRGEENTGLKGGLAMTH